MWDGRRGLPIEQLRVGALEAVRGGRVSGEISRGGFQTLVGEKLRVRSHQDSYYFVLCGLEKFYLPGSHFSSSLKWVVVAGDVEIRRVLVYQYKVLGLTSKDRL